MIFGQNLAMYKVFYEESESEVKKCKIFDPKGENHEIRISEICLLISLDVHDF